MRTTKWQPIFKRKITHVEHKYIFTIGSWFDYFIGVCSVCRKAVECPNFDRREGGACGRCDYLKEERKRVKVWRILTGVALLLFFGSTYLRFH